MPDFEATVAQAEGMPAGTADGGSVEQLVQDGGQQAGTGPNWDDEGNPYKQQFTGLQGNFKQVKAQLDQLQGQVIPQLVEAAMIARAEAEGRTPQEIAAIKQDIQAQNARQTQDAQTQALLQSLGPVAKLQVLNDIAQQFGVDPADLQDAPSPDAAIYLAQKLSKQAKQQNLQARKDGGVDKAESGGGGVPRDYSKLSPTDKIAEGLKNAKW